MGGEHSSAFGWVRVRTLEIQCSPLPKAAVPGCLHKGGPAGEPGWSTRDTHPGPEFPQPCSESHPVPHALPPQACDPLPHVEEPSEVLSLRQPYTPPRPSTCPTHWVLCLSWWTSPSFLLHFISSFCSSAANAGAWFGGLLESRWAIGWAEGAPSRHSTPLLATGTPLDRRVSPLIILFFPCSVQLQS